MSAPVAPQNPHPTATPAHPRGRYLARLSLLALGVVYGDIGTSPLYALREAFHGQHGIPVTPGNVLGVLSLIFWSLILIVTVKYHVVIIRADNKGEGGVLALMALVNGSRLMRGLAPRRLMIVLGIFGAALLYADGALTPAVSVLSAVEGLEIAAPTLQHWVILLTSLVILVGLFLFQKRGTAGVGAVFGPVMLIWFLTIAVLGLNGILRYPGIVGAVLPTHAIRFFAEDPGRGLLVLGAVFLAVTGGEALYADLGHFGHSAIQLAWFTVPLPALLLNYFGQGALLLTHPETAPNPFYFLAPAKALFFLIPLATAAAVIASGRDFGSILTHAPGRAARVHPPHGDRAYQLTGDCADLCAQYQLDADGFDDCSRLWLRVVEQLGGSVRRGAVHAHGADDGDVLRDEP